jgi:type I restriction enzyme S subunit
MSNKVKAGSMKEGVQSTLVPTLRFPEFLEAGDWKEKSLSACLDYRQPTPHLVSDTNYSPAFKTPVLTAGKTFILGYTNEAHGIFSDNLPVIIFDDFTTATQFVNFPFKAKSSAMKILLAKNGIDIKFMYETLQMLSYEVGAHERHWISNFAPMLVAVPELQEQHKIAECLTAVDQLFVAQARKLDGLKTHKKGLMQQLFPREGETQPRLRFPEFQNAGEWEIKSIGQLGEVVTGSTPSTARAEYYGGDRLFVSPGDISDDRFIENTKTTLTALGFGETRPVRANSILFVCIGSTIGKVAQNRHHCSTNQQINSVVPNLDNYDGFVYYALSGMTEKIANLAGIQAVPIVNKSLFSSVELAVPELPEQMRIADCLSSLDQTIFTNTQKLDALKTHKKGLMQQLFPPPEEVEA